MAKLSLEDKIARLEAELKETKAAANRVKRKERNKQLMALGIYMERLYKERSAEGRSKMRTQLESAALDNRVKTMALSGFSRIDEEAPAESRASKRTWPRSFLAKIAVKGLPTDAKLRRQFLFVCALGNPFPEGLLLFSRQSLGPAKLPPFLLGQGDAFPLALPYQARSNCAKAPSI